MKVQFVRQRRGVYATKDHRFYLEFWSSLDTWKLRERGELVGYKPSVSRTALAESPIWYRSNSARAAVAWARQRISGLVSLPSPPAPAPSSDRSRSRR